MDPGQAAMTGGRSLDQDIGLRAPGPAFPTQVSGIAPEAVESVQPGRGEMGGVSGGAARPDRGQDLLFGGAGRAGHPEHLLADPFEVPAIDPGPELFDGEAEPAGLGGGDQTVLVCGKAMEAGVEFHASISP